MTKKERSEPLWFSIVMWPLGCLLVVGIFALVPLFIWVCDPEEDPVGPDWFWAIFCA